MAKSKNKFYAVAAGKKPGIYTVWFGPDGAEIQVRGVEGARFKGFLTLNEAEAWPKNPGGFRPSSGHTKKLSAILPQADSKDRIIIYSDGGSINNPGPGGYGVVIIDGTKRQELSGGFRMTTNNRMELTGAIKGLARYDKPVKVLLRTDSQYVVKGIMEGWAKKWRKNGWMRTKNEPAENYDLWEKILELTEKHDVIFEWIKGHSGHDENERCDEMAREVSSRKDLPPDINYEEKRTTVLVKLF
jgi:ribonuclease HI